MLHYVQYSAFSEVKSYERYQIGTCFSFLSSTLKIIHDLFKEIKECCPIFGVVADFGKNKHVLAIEQNKMK
jgi:hypothetical protein